MSVETRYVTPSDSALFEKIAPEVFDEPVRPDRLAAYLAEPGHHLMVAIADGQIVAQCAAVVHRHPDKVTELYIDEVGVSPAYQRRGIARRLLDEMCAFGKSIGCVEAWVGTETDNTPARALYESARQVPGEPFVMYLFKL